MKYKTNWKMSLFGLLFGLLSYLIIIGYSPLIVSNIGWLYGGDPSTYYLGGAFFQISPWVFPPGLNPYYGLEIPSAIGLGDAIPLMAFIFKMIYPALGETPQYLGIWLLVCFMFQGLFGWLLLSRFTNSLPIIASSTLMLLFLPSFLARIIQLNHFPLGCHFLILAALLIYFLPVDRRRPFFWALLIFFSLLCNLYISAMVLVIWGTDLVAISLRREKVIISLIVEFILTIFLIFIVLWLSGFFVLKGGYQASGFGLYSANLLSLLDSKPGHLKYSFFFPEMPRVSSAHNAPIFIGTGFIFLIFISLYILAIHGIKFSHRFRPLLLIFSCVLMYLFALSNRISIGAYLFEIPISENIMNIASLFRDSGRFAWPSIYLLFIGVVCLISSRLKNQYAVCIFAIAAIIQICDTSPSWIGARDYLSARHSDLWPSPLKSNFWALAGKKYTKLRLIPSENHAKNYSDFAYYALMNKMRTNSIYLSRMDNARLANENVKITKDLAVRHLDDETLYILKDEYILTALKSIRPQDLLAKVDNFWVLAPNWFEVSGCKYRKSSEKDQPLGCIPSLRLKDSVLSQSIGWSPWGGANFNPLKLKVESLDLIDSGLVSDPIKLDAGGYFLTACMSWNVEGPPAGAAHLSMHGIKKLIEISTSKADNVCESKYFELIQNPTALQLSFGLGGWSTGKGWIMLNSLSIRPVVLN